MIHESTLPPVDATEVEVTMGREIHFPVKFNGFEVGPISVRLRVKQGENIEAAYLRARSELSVLFETEYQLKRKEWDSRRKGL